MSGAFPIHSSVLPDGLDQLPPRETLFIVILALVIEVEVCNRAYNVGNYIIDEIASRHLPI